MTGALVSGLLVGGLYALLALGFALKLRIADIVDIAHGSWVVLGMFATLIAVNTWGLDPYVGVAFSVAISAVVALPIYGVIIGPARRSGHREQVIYTLLLLSALQLAFQYVFGSQIQQLSAPLVPMRVLGVAVSRDQVIAGVVAIFVGGALFAFFRLTYRGKTIETAGRYEEGARSIGIPVERVYLGVFVMGTSLAGLAGGLIMTFQPVTPFLALEFVLVALLVTIAARMSFVGCLLVGLGYGVLSAVLTHWVGARMSMILVFVAFLVVVGGEVAGDAVRTSLHKAKVRANNA